MEYSGTRSASNLQSPTNHLSASNAENYVENNTNHSNDINILSPAPYSIYDEKHNYQNQPPSLNQSFSHNPYNPYGNTSIRPQISGNYHNNYWNLPKSQNETSRMLCTQYQDPSFQNMYDATYSKIDKMKSNDNDRTSMSDNRLGQNDDFIKSKLMSKDYHTHVNNFKSDTSSPKDNLIKSDIDKIVGKSNSIEMPDSVLPNSESNINPDFNPNSSYTEMPEKNDIIYNNSICTQENKINQSQLKHVNPVSYENTNYGQMMMHPHANYYSQLRYPSQQNSPHNYANPSNNSMMPNTIVNRPSIANYPSYMQTASPVPGYGYPQMAMHQARMPYNSNVPYVPISSQSPFPGYQDVYMNGTTHPLYSGNIKESVDRKEDSIPPVLIKQQETSDSGSTSNKSVTARSTKSKNAIKSESHPTTPVSNTIPSPSQTSMSSVIDDNEDSVSSLGPNDANVMSHPVPSQFNQHQSSMPNISTNPALIYPQAYPTNNNNGQIPPHMAGLYPGHMGAQPRPFVQNAGAMPGRPYTHHQHHNQSESQINNSCFQKLLELGSEPERGPWLERYLKFMHDNNTPLGAVPTVVKQPLDLFRLYHSVRERGGLLNVVKTKRWKEICHIVNVNASASGAYTLRRNYIKCLLDYECRFDRNGVDPAPILLEIQSLSDKKKKSTTGANTPRTAGSSSSSTVSSGQTAPHNPDFVTNTATVRPPLPPPDFNSPHSYPYGANPMINGALVHRSPMHYPSQRGPYPGPYPMQPRMMGYNNSPGPMNQPPVRYDAGAVPPNWAKTNPANQQQWPSPGSSSNSNLTHPMQMSMSPGTPTNSVSNSSQQSQQTGDNFEINSKDIIKMESRCVKTPDNFPEKDADKIETSTKLDPTYYNQPYSGYPGQDSPYDYYHSNKNMSANSNPSMQYQGFPFTRQYGSAYRQSVPSSLSYSTYYPPPNPNYAYPPGTAAHASNMTNNAHYATNSASSQPPYYPIGSLQEHTRRMEWKSNYGGMPPPPAPPPPLAAPATSLSSQQHGATAPSPVRGPMPGIIPATSQGILSSGNTQYHSSYPSQCSSPYSQPQRSNSQSQIPLGNLPQNRHVLHGSSLLSSNVQSDNLKCVGAIQSSSVASNSLYSLNANNCHSRLSQNDQSQFAYSKSRSNLLKQYDPSFPPNCVEATKLDYSKKRKYSAKDIKGFNPTNVTMALKCGLVAEVSWALNYLNIWSRDESFFEKLSLKSIMPLFQALIDVWRNSLGTVFGYDLFIKDLEMPICLEKKMSNDDLENILRKMERVLKNRQLKIESKEENVTAVNDFEENFQQIQEKLVEMLDCGKYNGNGLTVNLDLNSKLYSIFGNRSDFIEFLNELETESDNDSTMISNNYDIKYPNVTDLWEIGGSDSTFHVLPPILSQKTSLFEQWNSQLERYVTVNGCESHNCGPPEIKRSRCDSPSTPVRLTSSPAPPNLLHDTYYHNNQMDQSEVCSVEEALLFEIYEADEEKMMRCLAVSTVIRNLSFVPGNDRIMGSNRCLLVILGRLLLLGHGHGDEGVLQECWWQRWIDELREHVLVTLVNISSYLQLALHPDLIIQPIIAGLLHWLTCQSAEAEDALPSHRVLGCRRLSLESVMRLCVHDTNIDYILSPPTNTGSGTTAQLFDYLAASFCHPEVQVVKEMSLAVMHYLASGPLGCQYLAAAQPSVLEGLISFIEVTEAQIRHVVDNMGMEALQARPELMGTSLDFLRHSGSLLAQLAACDDSRSRFSRDHEMRMLNLVISTVLDQTVAQSISGVLFLLTGDEVMTPRRNRSRRVTEEGVVKAEESTDRENDETVEEQCNSFLTFDDLSFCDKHVTEMTVEGHQRPEQDDDERRKECAIDDHCIA